MGKEQQGEDELEVRIPLPTVPGLVLLQSNCHYYQGIVSRHLPLVVV